MTHDEQGFLALSSRHIFEGTLEACAPLHVGSGYGDLETGSDSGFISDATGPFVPGSSLRGVLRTTLERILQALGGGRGCVLFAEGSHPACPTVNEAKRGPLEREKDDRILMKKLMAKDGLCDICRLFGSPLLASKLRISDARPAGGRAPLSRRDGVGIDRDTGAAAPAIKFDFMAMEKAREDGSPAEFTFEMQLENGNATDWALLGILMRELTIAGIDIGGKKARGFGRLKLKPGYGVKYFDRDSLRDFLIDGKPKEMDEAALNTKLTQAVTAYFEKYFQPEETHAAATGE